MKSIGLIGVLVKVFKKLLLIELYRAVPIVFIIIHAGPSIANMTSVNEASLNLLYIYPAVIKTNPTIKAKNVIDNILFSKLI